MSTIGHKLRGNRGGFTLTELLVTTLIVVLIAIGVTAGISAAMRVYRQSRYVSESSTLSSTINTALSDVLRYADTVREEDGQLHFVSNSGYGNDCSLTLSGDGYLQYGETGKESLLVSQGAYTDLHMEEFTLAYNDATGVFSGGYTLKSASDDPMASSFTFTFRTVSETITH